MSGDRKRILIVDDDHETVKVMQIYFSRSGMIAKTAESGRGALKSVEKFQPDLMILDIRMPRVDGVEVCKTIRYKKGDRELPIIAVTGYHSEQKKNEILQAGANLYLTKPLDMGQLLKQVKELISAREEH